MRCRWTPVLGVLLGLGMASVPAAGGQPEGWTADYPLPADSQVSVVNVQGSIRVEGWDRSEVELTVIKTAENPGASLADVRILIEPAAESLRVRTVYLGESNPSVRVDYLLRVPRQVRLQGLRTVNGDIVVRNLEGVVEAHTLNGDIEQTGVAGSVMAGTLNGSVAVSLRALPEPGGRLELETINGDVILRLPSEANADLELSAVAGQIESDWLFEAAGGGDDTALRARLGRGGVPVRLRTIRGNIRVAASGDVL